jgi:hypothetical protein
LTTGAVERLGALVAEVSARSLARLGALPAAYEAIFLSGSVGEGWSHANSDLDVYVIADQPVADDRVTFDHVRLDPDVVPSLSAWAGGRRVDVQYWHPSQIDQVLAKVGELPQSGRQGAGSDLDPLEIAIVHRISVAVALENERWLRATKKRIRESAVRAIVACRYFNLAESLLNDATGLLRSDDLESAVLAARRGFDLTIDGLLATYGELAPSQKWRARKLRRSRPGEIGWEEFWRLAVMADLPALGERRWVEAVVARCQTLIGSVEIG